MKYFIPAFLIAAVSLSLSCNNRGAGRSLPSDPEEKLGWQLGVQTYTFKKFSFVEAMAKADSCQLKYLEAYPSQTIGGGLSGTMNYTMDDETKAKLRDLLKSKGLQLRSYGVVKVNGASEWRKVFSFCKEMGVQTITCEPRKVDLGAVSSLCDEYKINAAIHNHPMPSPYWHPDSVKLAVNGYSERLGACADVGHWVRSGLDPLECLKSLKGKVLHLHFKDLNELNNRKAHDVIWGTGVCNVPALIKELKAQQFKGMISAEYEYNWDNSVPDVKASVQFFRNKVLK